MSWINVLGYCAPLALFAVVLAFGTRRNVAETRRLNAVRRQAEGRCGCGWPDEVPHHLFVTAAPGYGTILPCPRTPVSASWGRIEAGTPASRLSVR